MALQVDSILLESGDNLLSESENLILLEIQIYLQNLSDNINFLDSLSSSTEFNKLLDDTQTIADSISSQVEFKVLLNELQSITDDLSRQVEFNVNLDDTITLSDSLSSTLKELVEFLSRLITLTNSNTKKTFRANNNEFILH